MMSSSCEAESDDAPPVIERFSLTRIWKTGHCVDRDEFAFVLVNVGGCQVAASLLFDGSLKLPAGVRVPLDLQQRVKREAQRLAIQGLAEEWDRQRDRDGRFLVGDAS